MKQVLYRKCTVGEMEGEIFACFPICRGGEIAVFNECGHGWLSLGYFTDCMEDATSEESAAVRKIIKEEEPIQPEEISFSDFMRIMFPEDNKRTFYRLPCDQHGQPSGQIENGENGRNQTIPESWERLAHGLPRLHTGKSGGNHGH